MTQIRPSRGVTRRASWQGRGGIVRPRRAGRGRRASARPRRSPRAATAGGSRRTGWRSRSSAGQEGAELAVQVLVAGRAEDERPGRRREARPQGLGQRLGRGDVVGAVDDEPGVLRPAPRPGPASSAGRTLGPRPRGRPTIPCSASTSRVARATAAFCAWCGPGAAARSSPSRSARSGRRPGRASGRVSGLRGRSRTR